MAFLTARKRAAGLGSAKDGTHHFWEMKISSAGLVILVPLFIFSFGSILGASYEDVVAYFARPFPALIAALTIVVAFLHFKNGVQVLIEDYSDGMMRKALIIATICLSYAAAATGVFAVARLAL